MKIALGCGIEFFSSIFIQILDHAIPESNYRGKDGSFDRNIPSSWCVSRR
jgi:hypothetical protein